MSDSDGEHSGGGGGGVSEEESEEEAVVAPPRRGAGKGFISRGKTISARPPRDSDEDSDAGGNDEDDEDDERGTRGGGDAVEAEAEEDDEQGYVDSSEEEEEGQDEYEKDGFLVDEDEDEEEDADEDSAKDKKKKKKKKRKRKRHMALDDDDYDLLEDNTGIRVKRPQQMRRIARKGGRDEEEEAEDDHRTAQQRLREDLFGGDDDLDEEEEDGDPAEPEGYEDDDLDADEDGLEDFIVDGDDDQAPQGRRKKKKRGVGNISSAALQEAQEIFGDVDSFLQRFRDMKARSSGKDDYDLGEEGDELDLSDEEEAADLRAARFERKEQRRLKMVRERIEPDLLAKFGLTSQDEMLRKVDMPERMAEDLDLMEVINEGTLEEAASWVYDTIFGGESRRSEARDLVEDGRREVDMLPQDGRDAWDESDLEGGLTDVRGLRGICRKRDDIQGWHINGIAQEKLRVAIQDVLRCFYIEKEDVPLVAMFRKELCGELLCCRKSDLPFWTTKDEVAEQQANSKTHEAYYPEGSVQAKHRRPRRWEVLWAVWDSSKTFAKLVKRRQVRTSAYDAALAQATSDEERDAILACLEGLSEARSPEVLDDLEAKFRLTLHSVEDAEGGSKARKAPKKTTSYTIAKRAGIGAILPVLGMSAQQFGENLKQGFKKNEPEDRKVSPTDLIQAYPISEPGFDDPERVQTAAQHMMAVELAADPAVRQEVRKLMLAECCVSTEPTQLGDDMLDPFHPYARVKRLREKPISRFEGSEQFLCIKMAEEEQLLRSLVGVPPAKLNTILDKLKDKYISEGVSLICQEWNQLRNKVLHEAVTRHLWPVFGREIRMRLESDARQELLTNYGSALWELASTPPLQVRLPDEDDYVDELRVMAVCWGMGGSKRDAGPPTVAAMLDPAGHMVDFLNLPQMSGRGMRPNSFQNKMGNIFNDPRKSRDANRVRDFITQHQPHVIIVGASGLDSWQLKVDMEDIRNDILEHNPEFMTRMETGTIDVRCVSFSRVARRLCLARLSRGRHSCSARPEPVPLQCALAALAGTTWRSAIAVVLFLSRGRRREPLPPAVPGAL